VTDHVSTAGKFGGIYCILQFAFETNRRTPPDRVKQRCAKMAVRKELEAEAQFGAYETGTAEHETNPGEFSAETPSSHFSQFESGQGEFEAQAEELPRLRLPRLPRLPGLPPLLRPLKLPSKILARPCSFKPSTHGFKFSNSFTTPPVIMQAIGQVTQAFARLSGKPAGSISGSSTYGLCGGMSVLAADYFRFGVPIPPLTTEPPVGSRLYLKLLERQLDSLRLNPRSAGPGFGAPVLKFLRWTIVPDHGLLSTATLTTKEFFAVRAALALGRLAVLGLVTTRSIGGVLENHQVLAHCLHKRAPRRFDIEIYDPNEPQRDDIRIEVVIVRGETLATVVRPALGSVSEHRETIRGFFIIPFVPKAP
jgi:hypothetical protein